MIPLRISGSTRHLGAPQGWEPDEDGECVHLAIRDCQIGNLFTMTSAWQPTDEEIAQIVAGAPIMLQVVGNVHPPVWLRVGDVPD